MNGTNVTLGALDTAANFSYVDALTAAQFSLWAYDEFDATRTTLLQNSGWTSITTGSNTVNGNGYQNSNAFAFAARRSNADGSTEFVISFEGTNGF
jgi:hypothetical protein